MLDDFSRYILAWKLCTTMGAGDVADTLQMALKASGLSRAAVRHRPRLLSDNGPTYVSAELGQAPAILARRQQIKHKTLEQRRRTYENAIA